MGNIDALRSRNHRPARQGWTFRPRSLLRDSRGSILLETAIASIVFALVGTAVLSGLSVMHRTGAMVEGHSVAENVARNQMEYVFTLPYQEWPATYPTMSAEIPNGYTVTALGEEYVAGDLDVQKVVVTAARDGEGILTIETVRSRQ
ncbi:MAG TPA: hypothetical protein VI855_08795 [Dehalococcoidia bacterium]|nr:hypothetical protein [Dehalococcoidia bacterium]